MKGGNIIEKSKELKKLISSINKSEEEKHQVIPTDIQSLDYILGGGIELGSKVQIVAESSTGKSTIALNICRNFCKKKLNVLYIDTENSITKDLLKTTNCEQYCNNEEDTDCGDLLLVKESEFKQVSKILDNCLKTKHFHLVIIDSLANLVNECYTDIDGKKKTKSEVKDLTNNNTNYESRPLNLFINKYSSLAKEYNVGMIYINQYRNKVDPTKGTILKEFGIKSVRYNSDIIIKIKKDKEEYILDENNIMMENSSKSSLPAEYSKLVFTIEKSNKLLTNTTVETYIKYGYGIDETLDKITSLIREKTIPCTNGWYEININNSTNKAQGMKELIKLIYMNLDDFNRKYLNETFNERTNEGVVVYGWDDED